MVQISSSRFLMGVASHVPDVYSFLFLMVPP